MEDKKLNELANDFFSFIQGQPTKRKVLRPLVKQMTYKGITKKWTFDGACLHIVGTKHTYDWELYKKAYGYETIEDAIKDMIEEEIANNE